MAIEGREAAAARDGELELVPEHTTDFAGGKSLDYAGTEVALEGSSVYGVLSSPTSREVNDEETAATL